ncbi:MAG: two-component sensor histidine kinase [Lachnospiraceae bacterium]|nr:two-component sensor histidine kinase [Lachnospiraceae bacterium]
MKRKIHLELLATSALAIVLTLLFALYVFYGIFNEQVINDLREDALTFKNLHLFDNVEEIHPDIYALRTESLRITVVGEDGTVLFDSDADSWEMENHLDRPEIQEAFLDGEASASRESETMSKNLFYYALRLDNGTVMRVSRVADSFFAVSQNMLPSVAGVCAILFLLCFTLSSYFTKSLVQPIEKMAENLSEPGVEVPYKELAPFMAKIRQQHEDILNSAQMRQEFTANVSHELKTPLTAISGYAELIEHGMASKETAARFAGEIHKNAARLLSLINDIIQLSQLDGGKKMVEYVDLDLYALAQECVDMLALNAQKQNVTMRVLGQKSMVLADKQLMEELVYNLCDNAIRYNNRGGSVTVTVDQENGHTFLLVQDTGIGISRENQERVFERFYRVDKSRSKATGGTGLGLAIVKHIVSQHGAKLSLESEEGKGTSIRVEFSDLIPGMTL